MVRKGRVVGSCGEGSRTREGWWGVKGGVAFIESGSSGVGRVECEMAPQEGWVGAAERGRGYILMVRDALKARDAHNFQRRGMV